MRHLLRSEYYPFGSQYYRAPSPPPEDWDADLGQMARLGFNTVKYWIQWRWNHPREDRFYFDDIDRLMDLAEGHGLKVMLNTIVDTAPAWIYRKYPDASMLTLDGRRIGPQTQPHRQIGGLGVCLNHDQVMGHLFHFLEAAIERYTGHPALEIWNVGSEPELTQSMSEMRLYADDARKMGDMLCFCDHCRDKFGRWLEGKYGAIDRLNEAWNRNYTSFDEAELPRTRNTFNDMIDWRMFFVHTLGENVRRRFEVAERVDAGRHPLMCHHVFIQGFPVTSTANDPWNVGRFGDLHGFTQMDDPMMADILRSCARGKPVMSAEMLMLMGYTLDLHAEIDADDIKRHVFTGIAAGIQGYVFWQYRPELLGREAPSWGLSHTDGSSTPRLESFAEVGRVLAENAAFLLDARPEPARVAILYNPENQIFAWAATGNEKSATDSLLGIHRALYEHNYVVDFVHPMEIADVLDQYRVLVVPMPYLLSEPMADVIRKWVEAGGVLIGEAYFAGWDLERGRHQTMIPGYGLHEVFQARQQWAGPADEHEYLMIDGVVRSGGKLSLRAGLNEPKNGRGFVMAREVDVSKKLGQVEIEVTGALPGVAEGTKLYGAMVRETFFVEGADVLAVFDDGTPAVTMASFGKGKAILIGSYLGLAHQRLGYPSNGAFIAALVEHAAGIDRPRVVGDARIRVDVLSDEAGGRMVVARNLDRVPVEASVRLPVTGLPELIEQFTGERLMAEGSMLTLALGPEEVKVYRG